MSASLEGPLLRRSIPFVEKWIEELTTIPKKEALSLAKAPTPSNPAATAPLPGNSKPSKKCTGANKAEEVELTAMAACCFAVGRVVEVSRHPESQKLYVEKIDMGPELNAATDNSPRVILSGLQEHVKEQDFLNRLVLIIANLEPRKIAGIPSNGMVLCASTSGSHDDADRKVTLLEIPEGTPLGERVVFEGHDMPYPPVLKKKLAKKFEEVMVDVKTNEEGVVCWKGIPFRTSAGIIKAPIPNACIS